MRKSLLLALVAVLSVGLVGCFQTDNDTVIMPDGSGKITLTVGISEQVKQMAAGMGGEGDMDTGNDSFEDLLKNTEGVVAFTEPETKTVDGYELTTFTLYFEDINKVKLYKDSEGERTLQLEFEYKEEGDGHLLIAKNLMYENDDAPDADMDPAEKQMMEGMMGQFLKGMAISETYTMPGEVTKAEGLSDTDGNTAGMSVTEDDVKKDGIDALTKLGETTTRKIWCGPSNITDEAQAEFVAELEKAKDGFDMLKEKYGDGK
jgi:hypothetical protein